MRWALQMTAFALLLTMFALQIPRSAIFFRPSSPAPRAPKAALVILSDAAYAKVMRRMRTADWSKPFLRGSGSSLDQGPDVSGLEETLPPPEGLPFASWFTPAPAPGLVPLPRMRPPLQPPSLAAPCDGPTSPYRSTPPAFRPDPELLDLESFETLKERK